MPTLILHQFTNHSHLQLPMYPNLTQILTPITILRSHLIHHQPLYQSCRGTQTNSASNGRLTQSPPHYPTHHHTISPPSPAPNPFIQYHLQALLLFPHSLPDHLSGNINLRYYRCSHPKQSPLLANIQQTMAPQRCP